MSRTHSSPGLESSIDRPMRLAEIYVASEHALRHTISNSDLWTSLSSVEEFEVNIFKLSDTSNLNNFQDVFHFSFWLSGHILISFVYI